MNLSVQKPSNQSITDYRGNDTEWAAFRAALDRIPKDFDVPMVIGGEHVYSDHKEPSLDPSTGKQLCTSQNATAEQAQRAILAALSARSAWSSLSIESRLLKFRDLEWILYERRHEICAVAAQECGYIATEVSVEWAEAMDFVRFNPWYLLDLSHTLLGDGKNETNSMQLRPLKGFTCAITPFNFPIAIGYNLPTVMAICGDTVVWKPSSDAPLTSYMLMKAIEDAGFPPGVINMITGRGPVIMAPVLENLELTAVNFTGGNDTARSIAGTLFDPKRARPHYPRFVAETGGKDFMVVDRSCDVWDAASCIVAGAFGRSGQKCSANSLVLADKKIWADLKAAILEQMRSFQMKSPLERDSDMGPVINQKAFDSITGFIKRAQADRHVRTIHGGEFSKSNGFWIQPTFFEVDTDEHELLNVEIFGPVTAIRPVENVEHAIRILEKNPYRLTGAVWSSDESFLSAYVPVLSHYAGNFYVNRKTTGASVDQQPFGGDGASGTNYKAGGAWYLLQFLSQGTITRRHARTLKAEQKKPFGWM